MQLDAPHILVTGATGFVGDKLVRKMLETGCPVIAMGRNNKRLSALEGLGAKIIVCSLSECAELDIEHRIDSIVHLAALSSNWGPYDAFHTANVEGTRHILTLANKVSAKRFVHISTPSVYFRFRDQFDVSEDAVLPTPVNAYAATKAEAERLVLNNQSDLSKIVLRPRGIYGEGDTALLPRLMRAAEKSKLPLVREGQAVTDLTHVDDVVGAILSALEAPKELSKSTFNISGGVALNIKTVIERACDAVGVKPRWKAMPSQVLIGGARILETVSRITPGRPEPVLTAYSAGILAYSQTLNIDAANEHLNWSPKISFEEGLARTIGELS